MSLPIVLNELLFAMTFLGERDQAVNLLGVEQRRAAILYASVVLTVAAPYIVGFAFTRHASVLILPSALYLVYGWTGAEGGTADSLDETAGMIGSQ